MKLPKYGIIIAIGLVALYLAYIVYSLLTGAGLQMNELIYAVVFIIGMVILIIADKNSKNKDKEE